MSGENQRTPLMAAKLAGAIEQALQPPIKATEQELRVARAICEADSHAWPDDSYNGRAQIRAFLRLARAAMSSARVAELETEKDRLRAECDTLAAQAGACAEEIDQVREQNRRLRIALHDAIRRPLGVTPDSAAEFYDPRMSDSPSPFRPRPTAPIPEREET